MNQVTTVCALCLSYSPAQSAVLLHVFYQAKLLWRVDCLAPSLEIW